MRPEDLDRSEILMYLNTTELEGELSDMLDECTKDLCKAVQPRSIYRVLDVEHDEQGVCIGGLRLLGKDIALHLSGCKQAVLMAATLSAPVDALIRRAEVSDMTKALMYDAVAGAAIEYTLNELESQIKQKYPFPYYTARFSAGYGDLPISQQTELIQMLDATRKIGLTVTAAHTLLPLKSVTAIMGMSHQPVKDARRFGCGNSCDECPYHDDCKMRK